MYALIIILFFVALVLVKLFKGIAREPRTSDEFHQFYDPGNFVHPFNEFNQ